MARSLSCLHRCERWGASAERGALTSPQSIASIGSRSRVAPARSPVSLPPPSTPARVLSLCFLTRHAQCRLPISDFALACRIPPTNMTRSKVSNLPPRSTVISHSYTLLIVLFFFAFLKYKTRLHFIKNQKTNYNVFKKNLSQSKENLHEVIKKQKQNLFRFLLPLSSSYIMCWSAQPRPHY